MFKSKFSTYTFKSKILSSSEFFHTRLILQSTSLLITHEATFGLFICEFTLNNNFPKVVFLGFCGKRSCLFNVPPVCCVSSHQLKMSALSSGSFHNNSRHAPSSDWSVWFDSTKQQQTLESGEVKIINMDN